MNTRDQQEMALGNLKVVLFRTELFTATILGKESKKTNLVFMMSSSSSGPESDHEYSSKISLSPTLVSLALMHRKNNLLDTCCLKML